MARIVLLFLLVTLSACAPRPTLVFAPEAAAGLPTRTVFVATTRSPEGSGFGTERSLQPHYQRHDISVPPLRETGTIPSPHSDIDPETQFLSAGQVTYADAPAFRADLRRALAARRERQREAIIYVHGFNNTFDEGVLRITQMAEDFEVSGVAVHYSWPSAGNPLGYAYDRDSVLIARDGLDALISDVRAAGAQSIVLVAHSLGAQLVMETLRQRAIARPGSVARDIDGVVLISPDIDVQLFRSQAARIGRLPDPFGIFVSKRDRVLLLSARLTGLRNRLGNVDTVDDVADLDVTILDVTDFSTGAGHFTPGSSPALIKIFANAGVIDTAFRGDRAGRAGLIPGTVLTVQNATQIILSPVTALAQ